MVATVVWSARNALFLIKRFGSNRGKLQWITRVTSYRLSNRDAAKILAVLPSLNRAAAGTIIEMGRVRAKLDEKSLCLAVIEEVRQDWERTLSGDNPELISVFEDVAKITRSRLEMDTDSLLEVAMSRLDEGDEG